jgi:hypothetical protein
LQLSIAKLEAQKLTLLLDVPTKLLKTSSFPQQFIWGATAYQLKAWNDMVRVIHMDRFAHTPGTIKTTTMATSPVTATIASRKT